MSEVPGGTFSLDSLEKAIELATVAHEGQIDKGGQPYVNHPLRVMEELEGEPAKMVGVLHDVVEDTSLTLDDLRRMGCPEEVITALELLSHPDDYGGTEEEYLKGIQQIADSRNQSAIDVKWVDLKHNLDISRIPNPSEKDRRRLEKYRKGREILRPFVSGYLLQTRRKS